MVRHALVIFVTELRLLVRNRAAATFALGLPLAVGGFLAWQQPNFGLHAAHVWPAIVTTQIIAMLGFAIYITTTGTFAARRQALFLKRLRSGEASDAAIIAGLALPTLGVALVQVAIVLGFSVYAGAPWPTSPGLVVLAVLGTAATCSTAGVLTSTVTQGAEHAQFTTAPFFFALLVGGLLVVRAGPDATLAQLALPGGAVAELVRLAWQPAVSVGGEVTPMLGLLAAWVAVPALLAARLFRWEPRAA